MTGGNLLKQLDFYALWHHLPTDFLSENVQNLLAYGSITKLNDTGRYLVMTLFLCIGIILEFTHNWDHQWPCASDITSFAEFGYITYYYIANFLQKMDSKNILFAAMYGGYGVESILNVRCEIDPRFASSYKDNTRQFDNRLEANIDRDGREVV